MKSSATFSALATVWGLCTLSSCVYIPFNQLIPDTQTSVPQQRLPQTPVPATQPAAAVTTAATAATTPAAAAQQTPPATQATPAATPAPAKTTNAPKKEEPKAASTASTQATKAVTQPTQAKVSITTPSDQPDKKPDLSSITNENGYIPYAVRVPGDPTRVYNPLAPKKTIRILDKNGNPYPKDTQLKVKGTNFKFKIP